MRISTRTGGPAAPIQARRPDRGRRIPSLVTWVLVVATGLGGCSFSPEPVAPPPRPQQPVLERPVEPLVGSYRAERVTGDFAGYASLERFIELMATRHGLDRAYLNGLFSQARRRQWTLDYLARSDRQMKKPPPVGGWSRYRSQFLDERRIAKGVAFARRHRAALDRAGREYGVPPGYILGILAVETNFGEVLGRDRILDALTTLGFDYARRSAFFQGELEQFLLMASQERLDPARPRGSFAGAMGLGQFMPSSFRKWAVDFNGDGRRDLWHPEDAIGSIAHYFASHGWQAGQPVVTPLSARTTVDLQAGLHTRYSLSTLRQAGLSPAAPCRCEGELRLLRLRHRDFDQYLVGHDNFYTITRYNQSTHYAMAVHELAGAISRRL
jgi:membrane-bound lytic murein transglycosylase B